MVRGARPIPLVPLIVNTAAPPLPSMPRCVQLGRALGAAVRGADFAGRVLVVASGGLSHWLPSNDPRDPAVDGERRAAVIHGRADLQAFAAAREPRVRAMGGDPNAPVNRRLGHLVPQTADHPGPGAGHRAGRRRTRRASRQRWARDPHVAHRRAAVDRPFVWTGYEAVPEWITGMGIATTFAVD